MRTLYFITLCVVTTLLWKAAGELSYFEMIKLEETGHVPYGPSPRKSAKNYYFNESSTNLMAKYSLNKLNLLPKSSVQEIVLSSFQFEKDKENVKRYLPKILSVSEEYQLDPFWVLSIVMVESRFQTDVTSPKNAKGLMQIKLDTAHHLQNLMANKSEVTLTDDDLTDADKNLELGAFYLKKLLQNFRMDIKHATIAYNVGPNKLKNVIANKEETFNDNEYYRKVYKAHQMFTRNYEQTVALIPDLNKDIIVSK